jgi:S1-C subfamily serine protease
VEAVAIPADPLAPVSLPKAIPTWARLVMLPLVLVLPVLAVIALILRIALRAAPPRTQQAWHSYLGALLIASSFVFTVTAVLLFSYMPSPPQAISAGLPELDERSGYPGLPSPARMTGVDVAKQLKPLVMIASPAARRWFSRTEAADTSFGAAILLHADAAGYLFATARHVAFGEKGALQRGQRVLLATGTSGWAGADVIAWHRSADIALLWMPRREGSGNFVQPLGESPDAEAGVNVFVIGHPEGLNYTISSGIVSRTVGDHLQISAPVSPGNSGGPVYDEHGNLLGVVSAKLDRALAPNAENLNFAVAASLFRRTSGWDFVAEGQKRLTEYLNDLKKDGSAQETTGK